MIYNSLSFKNCMYKLIFLSLLLWTFNVNAITGVSNPVGNASNHSNVFNMLENPAWGSISDDQFNRSYIFGFKSGLYFELAGIQSLNMVRNNLNAALNDSNVTIANANDSIAFLNDFLSVSAFRLKQTVDTNLLIGFSLGRSADSGFLTLNYSRSLFLNQSTLSRNGAILDQSRLDALIIESIGSDSGTIDRQAIVNTVATDSALYVKSVVLDEFALTYSLPLGQVAGAAVYLGTNLKLIGAILDKQTYAFRPLLENSQGATNRIKDNFTEVSNSASRNSAFSANAVSADVGVMFDWNGLRVGLTGFNINTPELTYPNIGTNCRTSDQNCLIAQSYSDRISLSEKYVIDSRYRLEGGFSLLSKAISVSADYDLKDYLDPLGESYQWLNLAFRFTPYTQTGEYLTNWIPSIQIAHHANLSGFKDSYYTVGIPWGPLTFDIAATSRITDVSKINDGDGFDNEPLILALNIGLDIAF